MSRIMSRNKTPYQMFTECLNMPIGGHAAADVSLLIFLKHV